MGNWVYRRPAIEPYIRHRLRPPVFTETAEVSVAKAPVKPFRPQMHLYRRKRHHESYLLLPRLIYSANAASSIPGSDDFTSSILFTSTFRRYQAPALASGRYRR